jgi:hypothetical protein
VKIVTQQEVGVGGNHIDLHKLFVFDIYQKYRNASIVNVVSTISQEC